MKKRLTCLLLALIMAVSLVSFPAAAGHEPEWQDEELLFRITSSDDLSYAANIIGLSTLEKTYVIRIENDITLSKPVSIYNKSGQTIRIEGCEVDHGEEDGDRRPIIAASYESTEDTDMLLVLSSDGSGQIEVNGVRFEYPDTCSGGAVIGVKNMSLYADSIKIGGTNAEGIRFTADGNGIQTSASITNSQIFSDMEGGSTGVCAFVRNDASARLQFFSGADENGFLQQINSIQIGEGEPDVFICDGLYGDIPEGTEIEDCRKIEDCGGGWHSVGLDESQIVAEVKGPQYDNGDSFSVFRSSLERAVEVADSFDLLRERDTIPEIILYKDTSVDSTMTITKPLRFNGNGKQITVGHHDDDYTLFNISTEFLSLENAHFSTDSAQNVAFTGTGDSPFIQMNGCSFSGFEQGALIGISANISNCEFANDIYINTINAAGDTSVHFDGCELHGALYHYCDPGHSLEITADYCTWDNTTGPCPDPSYTDGISPSGGIGVGKYKFNPQPFVDENMFEVSQGPDDQGWYSVSVKPDAAVCFIGDGADTVYYEDIYHAINQVKDGETIWLVQRNNPGEQLNPIFVYNTIDISNGKSFTIQGHQSNSMIFAGDWFGAEFRDDCVFRIGNGSDVTLKDITVYGSGAPHIVAVEPTEDGPQTHLTIDGYGGRDDGCVFLTCSEGAIKADDNDLVTLQSAYFDDDGNNDRYLCFASDDVGVHNEFEPDDSSRWIFDENLGEFRELGEDEDYDGQCYMRLTKYGFGTIALESDGCAGIGGTYSVDLVIRNNTGLAGAGLKLTYDPAVFQVKSITYDDDFKQAIQSTPLDNRSVNGEIKIGWACEDNLYGDFTVATVTFSVEDGISEGNANFGLEILPAEDDSFTYKNLAKVRGGVTESTVFNICGTDAELKYMPGDVDGDLALTIADVQYMLKYVIGYAFNKEWIDAARQESFTEAQFRMAADVDEDGVITVIDVVKVLRVVMGYPEELN